MNQEDRDRLARWMGWHEGFRSQWKPWPETDFTDRVWLDSDGNAMYLISTWLNPPDGNAMLTLLERLREKRRFVRLFQGNVATACDILETDGDGRTLAHVAERETPEAVAAAVLAMIGKEMLEARE